MTRWSVAPPPGRQSEDHAPCAITTTRSEWLMTTSMSCSTKRKVVSRSSTKRGDMIQDPASERRVDARHGLVKQQKRGLGHQRARELEKLALAARERAGVIRRRAVEAEQLRGSRAAYAITRALLCRADRPGDHKESKAGARPAEVGAASSMLSMTGMPSKRPGELEGAHQAEAGDPVWRTPCRSDRPFKQSDITLSPAW